jgi:hypothetical protein
MVHQYSRDNPPEGYDQVASRVNQSYRRTGDIRLTMNETGLTFDVVWEAVGFKDEMDWLDWMDDTQN